MSLWDSEFYLFIFFLASTFLKFASVEISQGSYFKNSIELYLLLIMEKEQIV